MIKKLFLAAFITVTANSVFANESNKMPFGLAIRAGAYAPLAKETKDMFGSPWISFGVRPDFKKEFKENWVIGPDFDILTRSSKGNRVLAVRGGVVASKEFGQPDANAIPYVAVALGGVYYDYVFKRSGKRIASKRFGLGGSVEGGVEFNRKFKVSGYFNLYNSPDSLNLNGVGLEVSLKLF